MKLNTEVLERIKKVGGTNDKIFIAVTEFTDAEHMYMSECFNKTIYGISKTNIAKAIGYDKEHYGTFEDLGDFLITIPLGGYDVLASKDYRYNNFSYLHLFLETVECLSGNKQVEELQNMLRTVDPLYRPYFIRVLLKNPRMGVNESTYNKIRIKQGLKPLKQWYVKLAEVLEPEMFDTLDYPVAREIKYDGERAVCFITDNKVTKILTRVGNNIIEQYPEIVRDIEKSFNMSEDSKISCVLDMEICSSSFNALQKRMNRLEENINTDFDLTFYVFDIIEFETLSLIKKPLQFRRHVLEVLERTINSPLFKLTDYVIVKNHLDLQKEFDKAVKNGEEGIMVKILDSKWALKKDDRTNWFKVKPVYTSDLEIYDAQYGNGKNKDHINILSVKDKSGNIKSNVSAGMTDMFRELFTKLHKENKLIGKIVEIKYNQITDTNSLRFPRIVKLRNDKDEVDTL